MSPFCIFETGHSFWTAYVVLAPIPVIAQSGENDPFQLSSDIRDVVGGKWLTARATARTLVVAAIFIVVVGGTSLASAPCNETCVNAKAILSDRGNGFREATRGSGPANFRCQLLHDSYVCRIIEAPQAIAETAFSSSLLGFQKAEPRWKWFRATNARYQGPGEFQIYGGPSRGHYFVDMWLARRGKRSAANFGVHPNAEDTTFHVVPCQGSCLPH